jgi:hypothetical protein
MTITAEQRTLVEQIHAQREEILTSFVAKYLIFPEECEQITREHEDGTLAWYVQKKKQETP